MKLKDILEDFTYWGTGQNNLQHTASGGLLKSSGLWMTPAKADPNQHRTEIDFLQAVAAAGDEGYYAKMTYERKQRAESLRQNGLVDLKGDRYYITRAGLKWIESFREINPNWIKSHIPSYSQGVGGIGK